MSKVKTAKQQAVIKAAADLIRQKFGQDHGGHDWYRMERVWKMAKRLAKAEGADLFIVEMAALLHDYADWKLSSNPEAESEELKQWLRNQGVSESDITHINAIIENLSFKGLTHESKQTTIEGKVVQDADRLDAIGAISIARTFAYAGHKGRMIHDPTVDLHTPLTDEEFRANTRSGLVHFYDKLLHLKDRINTKSAKAIAEERHRYMEEYVERFLAEWDGQR